MTASLPLHASLLLPVNTVASPFLVLLLLLLLVVGWDQGLNSVPQTWKVGVLLLETFVQSILLSSF
jgi:hypothetical protein